MSGTLKREFTLWSAFAFAFAFISPIVAIYGILDLLTQQQDQDSGGTFY